MGVLSGILDFASHAVQPTLDVATAREQGQAAAQQRTRQDLLQQYMMQRQAQDDATKRAVAQSAIARNGAQTSHFDAQTNALNHPPAKILRGPNGQLVNVTDPANATPVGPTPSPKRVKIVGPDGTVRFVDPNNPPAGLKAHISTRGGSSASDTDLNRTIGNVRAQIADTQRQQNALQPTIRAGVEPFATPEAKQAAAAATLRNRQLSTRLDSLRSVHDRLIQHQQQAGGFVPPASDSAAPDGAPDGNPNGSATQQSPEASRAMQQEFDQASRDFQAVMSSSAPDSIKQRARELYNQRQMELAGKYRLKRGAR